MFDIILLKSYALHYSNREARKVQKDSRCPASARALQPNYLLSCAQVFRIAYRSLEVNPETEHSLRRD